MLSRELDDNEWSVVMRDMGGRVAQAPGIGHVWTHEVKSMVILACVARDKVDSARK